MQLRCSYETETARIVSTATECDLCQMPFDAHKTIQNVKRKWRLVIFDESLMLFKGFDLDHWHWGHLEEFFEALSSDESFEVKTKILSWKLSKGSLVFFESCFLSEYKRIWTRPSKAYQWTPQWKRRIFASVLWWNEIQTSFFSMLARAVLSWSN